MTNLLDLQEQLQDTNAAILALEKEVIKHPEFPSLAAVRRSLEKRQHQLETGFLSTAKSTGLDVCTYRSFSEKGTVKAAPAFAAVAEFQNVFSVTYEARKSGPKSRGTIPQQVAADTAFEFGYGFMGSVGFVLTLPNERLLLTESELDEAMADVFAMAKAASSDDILAFAKRLGVTPVNAIYKWAKLQSKNLIGADIDWRRGEEVRNSLFIQPQELSRLTEIIDSTSDEEVSKVVIEGTLDDVQHTKRKFMLTVEGGEISGSYADAIGPDHQVSIPGVRYIATLRKTVTTIFSTGVVNESYFLLELKNA